MPTLEDALRRLYANFIPDSMSTSWKTINTAHNNCLLCNAGGTANRLHITCQLLGLLTFKDRAQQLHSRLYFQVLSMHNSNLLRAMLNRNHWFPKTNHRTTVRNHYLLRFQFLNRPSVFTPNLQNLLQTLMVTVCHDILNEIAPQKWFFIYEISTSSQLSCYRSSAAVVRRYSYRPCTWPGL